MLLLTKVNCGNEDIDGNILQSQTGSVKRCEWGCQPVHAQANRVPRLVRAAGNYPILTAESQTFTQAARFT